MSSWYRFCCRCPGCGGGEPTNWYHAEESCCSTVGWLYINGECNIKCDECYEKKDKKPSFVLGWELKNIKKLMKCMFVQLLVIYALIIIFLKKRDNK